ncbi:hypothetical protein AKUH3B111A_09080 [Apilactobacillus kunkeei]|nr:hypothetical protein AKUH3B103M_09110 [Apilactobacillus kunkeei]CAI2615821.1 hypothetical protein AKUH3B104X_09110 [Apilactobacillus kunkeei]CAI2618797.1 hypothetical protein AKUH3B111A_09080 [Apilactobacillus kunkeei]
MRISDLVYWLIVSGIAIVFVSIVCNLIKGVAECIIIALFNYKYNYYKLTHDDKKSGEDNDK